MKFEKRNFMGIELDVLTGHPEHDLLFVATQVARAAGLKDPSAAIRNAKKQIGQGYFALASLLEDCSISLPKEPNGYSMRSTTVLMTEGTVNQMLLRGHAPASEPFRKWVTEEVLPTIRRTGKYDAEQSTNPIAMSVMDELKTLRLEMAERDQRHSAEISELKTLIQAMALPSPVTAPTLTASQYLDPDIPVERVWRHFSRALMVKVCEMKNLSVPVADKLTPAMKVQLEVNMIKLWNEQDHRKLKSELSQTNKRPWSLFPFKFLEKNMRQDAYVSALAQVLNAKLS